MEFPNIPVGTIRHDKLLNALLALWKTQNGISTRNDSTEFSQGYRLGFEEGLDAIAQIAGLTDAFEAGKALHWARIRARIDSKIDIVEGEITLIDPSKIP